MNQTIIRMLSEICNSFNSATFIQAPAESAQQKDLKAFARL